MQHQLTFECRKCCFIKTFEGVKHIGMNTKGHIIEFISELQVCKCHENPQNGLKTGHSLTFH